MMHRLSAVMPGFMPGIHVLVLYCCKKDVDGRDKPGHDHPWCTASPPSCPALCRASTSWFCTAARKTWMAGTSPAMTTLGAPPLHRHARLYAGHPRLGSVLLQEGRGWQGQARP